MSGRLKILILLGTAIGVLAFFGVRAVIRAHSGRASAGVTRGLETIDAAKKQWEMERAQSTNTQSTSTNSTAEKP